MFISRRSIPRFKPQPAGALACSVCFGNPDSPLTQGALAGVLFLMGVIAFVLLGVAWTAYVWWRRSKKL